MREEAASAANRVTTAAKETAKQAVEDTTTTAAQSLQKSIDTLRASNLQLRVRTALGVSQNLGGSSISVALEGKKIILNGTVQNAKQKQIAQQIAVNTLNGKMTVVNKLRVPGAQKAAAKKPR